MYNAPPNTSALAVAKEAHSYGINVWRHLTLVHKFKLELGQFLNEAKYHYDDQTITWYEFHWHLNDELVKPLPSPDAPGVIDLDSEIWAQWFIKRFWRKRR